MRVELHLMRFVPYFMWFVLVLLRFALVLLRFVLLCHEGRTSFLCSTCTFSFQLVIETPKFVLHSEQLRSLLFTSTSRTSHSPLSLSTLTLHSHSPLSPHDASSRILYNLGVI